ncbi:MAG: hypothetical protein QOG05_2996 [Streptosporangiaceae bacterium]|jgi:hypothetical protein|nr:hypothetical protein [Streptosporangiaceae bacterium]
MRRIPVLLPVSACAAALVLVITGCSSGGSRSTQAEQAMYAAVSKPLAAAPSLPAGEKWAGGRAQGLRMAVPDRWVTVAPAARPGALHAVGLGRLRPAVLNAVVPGWASPGSVTLADPGPPGDQAVMSLSCAAAALPAGTNALTGLNTLAEQEFTAINSSNAQLGQTTVDGHPAVLVYNQMSVGTASVTALQYEIAAPAGRTCYVTLATEKQVPYEPAFSRFRPGIQLLGA